MVQVVQINAAQGLAGLRDTAPGAEHAVGVVNYDVMLSTLEERLKRKQQE